MRGARRQQRLMERALVAVVTLPDGAHERGDGGCSGGGGRLPGDPVGPGRGTQGIASWPPQPPRHLARAVVIVPALKLNITSLTEFVQSKGLLLGGLLLLLPQSSTGSGGDGVDSDENVAKALSELEQWLVHNTFQFPVYFAYENDNMQSILQEVSANDAAGRPATATTGGYKLVISVSEPNKLASPTMTNIQGSLCADWKCLGMVTRTASCG